MHTKKYTEDKATCRLQTHANIHQNTQALAQAQAQVQAQA